MNFTQVVNGIHLQKLALGFYHSIFYSSVGLSVILGLKTNRTFSFKASNVSCVFGSFESEWGGSSFEFSGEAWPGCKHS